MANHPSLLKPGVACTKGWLGMVIENESKAPETARNFLRWRRGILGHVQKGKLKFPSEYGMFSYLCTKANPHTDIVETNFSELAKEVHWSKEQVRYVCGCLREKGYIRYSFRRGSAVVTQFFIDKYPLSNGTYTTLEGGGLKPFSADFPQPGGVIPQPKEGLSGEISTAKEGEKKENSAAPKNIYKNKDKKLLKIKKGKSPEEIKSMFKKAGDQALKGKVF